MSPAGQATVEPETEITTRLATLNQQIAAACARAGRAAAEVTLVAVSKTVAPERISAALAAGVYVLGENRVQEAAGKIAELTGAPAEWHLIGHLQSNKARRAVELFDAIQSVDSFKLAERLNQICAETGRRLPVFLEVNLGGEAAKAGVAPAEVLRLCEQVGKLAQLELKGLMAVPPFLDDAEQLRPFFRHLRLLRADALKAGIVPAAFRELSMGMSNDFAVAIEEGATFVRVGTALFGARN